MIFSGTYVRTYVRILCCRSVARTCVRTYVTDMPNGDQPGGRPHLCTQTYVRSANLLTQADAYVLRAYVGARGGAWNAQSGTPPGPDTYVRTLQVWRCRCCQRERERVAREREREWGRASLSSPMMTTHQNHHHRTYLDVSGQAIWCCEFDADKSRRNYSVHPRP